MKAGKGQAGLGVCVYVWVTFQGHPPEAGGLAPEGLDPGHHQISPYRGQKAHHYSL